MRVGQQARCVGHDWNAHVTAAVQQLCNDGLNDRGRDADAAGDLPGCCHLG